MGDDYRLSIWGWSVWGDPAHLHRLEAVEHQEAGDVGSTGEVVCNHTDFHGVSSFLVLVDWQVEATEGHDHGAIIVTTVACVRGIGEHLIGGGSKRNWEVQGLGGVGD